MQIVIDIPDDDYENKTLVDYFGCYSKMLDATIYNGTVLPKGHGKLIDADALKRIGRYSHTNSDIDNAPTIIEADKKRSRE